MTNDIFVFTLGINEIFGRKKMGLFFNPFNKKERDALQTSNGKRGIQIAVVVGVIIIVIVIISWVI